MRAVRYSENGGPDVMSVETVERPTPGQNDVLVEVRAASVNPVDTLVREGSPTKQPDFPLTPGSDFAGVVTEVGADVDAYEVGDRVYGDGLDKWTDYQGSFAEYAVVPLDRVAHLPESVGFEQGAAVAHVGLTAWRALVDFGGLQVGDTCLVHGGSGGVGHVAVQLASDSGTRVIATAGSEESREFVAGLGADAVFDYDRPDLESAIADAGAPDVILDHKLDLYLDLDIAVAATNARIVGIESSRRDVTFANGPLARRKDVELHFMGASSHPDIPRVFERIGRLMAEGDLDVTIARRYELEEAPQAHRDLIEDSFIGKLLVVP